MLNSPKLRKLIHSSWLKIAVWVVVLGGVVILQSGALQPATVGASIVISATVNDPVIENVLPGSGPQTGNTRVSLSGTNLDSVIGVTFGGVSAQSFTIESPTLISALTPPGQPGAVKVVVLTDNNAASLDKAFTYIGSPTPTSNPTATPTSGIALAPVSPGITASPATGGNTTPTTATTSTATLSPAPGSPSPGPGGSQSPVTITPAGTVTPASSPVVTATAGPTTSPVASPIASPGQEATISPTAQVIPTSSPAITLPATLLPTQADPTLALPTATANPTPTPTLRPTEAVVSPTSEVTQEPPNTPVITSEPVSPSPDTIPPTLALTTPTVSPVAISVIPSATPTPAITGSTTPETPLTTVVIPVVTATLAPTPTAIVAPTPTPGTSLTPTGTPSASPGPALFPGPSASAAPTGEPPTIESISPSSGPATGGTRVILKGTNFNDQILVTLGGLNPASVTIDSPTQITIVTAAQPAGAVSVVVKTGTGLAAVANGFTFTSGSVVISQSPTNFNYTGKLTGKALVLKSSFSVGVNDSSGSGAGWHLVARSTVLSSGTEIIPVKNHTIQNVQVTTKSGLPPENRAVYPQVFPTTDATIFTAEAGSGTGESIVTFETQLVIPPDIPPGNYRLTLNVMVEPGPA